jgi:hypothetical protein
VLLAAEHVHEAVVVDAAQVARGPPLAGTGTRVAEVAAEQAAGDLDLAIARHAQPRMRQQAAGAAGAVAPGRFSVCTEAPSDSP